jgi:hypothetical protein
MPVSITDDASQFPAITTPAGADVPNAASVQTSMQQLANRTAYLNARALAAPIAEGFESATFPPPTPAGVWATPSPRFATDSAWVRSTTNPIAGTASASAPVPQTLSTNSSLGLTAMLWCPSRLVFQFAVNGNNNTSDHLDCYIDGVLVFSMSTIASNTLVAGIYYSDMLREGLHTVDWRWVRGGSASVGSEECKIDVVQILPEDAWRTDPTRVLGFDDGFIGCGTGTTFPALGANANTWLAAWIATTGTNVGKCTPSQNAGSPRAFGGIDLQTTNTAAGDFVTAALQGVGNAWQGFGSPATNFQFVEGRVHTGIRVANQVNEVGVIDNNGAGTRNFVGWAWDGSNGATSTWRFRSITAGAVTSADSGIASADSTYFRLGVAMATVRGVTSAVFTKDGKALPGTGNVPPILTGVPNGAALLPGFGVRSITAAITAVMTLDWMRVLSLR